MHEEVKNYVEELLANQACPIDTWIHLQSCLQCSQQLEALRRVSKLFPPPHGDEIAERDPLFYARVQARIEAMCFVSPWDIFLNRGLAKRLVLTCLACTGFLAIYWFSISSEESQQDTTAQAAEFTSPDWADQETQRNAVLVNLVLDAPARGEFPR